MRFHDFFQQSIFPPNGKSILRNCLSLLSLKEIRENCFSEESPCKNDMAAKNMSLTQIYCAHYGWAFIAFPTRKMCGGSYFHNSYFICFNTHAFCCKLYTLKVVWLAHLVLKIHEKKSNKLWHNVAQQRMDGCMHEISKLMVSLYS